MGQQGSGLDIHRVGSPFDLESLIFTAEVAKMLSTLSLPH